MIVRELVARFGFAVDSSGLDTVDRKIGNTKKSISGVGKAFSGAFAGLAAYGVGGKINDAVDAANSFGEAMGKIQSLIPGNTARTKEYREAIIGMAKDTGQSLEDVAAGAYDVVSTFGDSADAISQLGIAVKTGAAGAATTKDGLALLGAVTKAYGDTSAKTMQQVADLGFQTVNLGKVELPELASSIGIASPLAANLGVHMEELFAVMASASGVTGSGSEVMTQMSSSMSALVKKTPEMKKAWKKAFGKESVKDAVAKDGVVGVFNRLVDTTDGSIEKIDELFGRIEGLKLILQLTGKGAADFNDKLHAMQNVAGATDTAFTAMRGGMAANATQAKKTAVEIEALKVGIGDDLSGAVNDLQLQLLQFGKAAASDFHDVMTNMNDDGVNAKTSLDGITQTVRPMTIWFAKLALAIDTAGGALDKFIELGDSVDEGVAQWGSDMLSAMMGGSGGALPEYMQERVAKREEDKKRRTSRLLALSEYIEDPDAASHKAVLNVAKNEVAESRAKAQAGREAYFAAIRSGNAEGATTSIGQINVALEIPANAEPHHIETAVRNAMGMAGKDIQQARRAIPNRTDKSGAEGWGPKGTNNAVGG